MTVGRVLRFLLWAYVKRIEKSEIVGRLRGVLFVLFLLKEEGYEKIRY